MGPVEISLAMFACIFGGAVAGMFVRAALPGEHLQSDSRDSIKVGMGFVGTMVALVLGLLVASAKSSYDTQGNELTQISANMVLLDRVLVHYGPESAPARAMLRDAAETFRQRLWTPQGASASANTAASSKGDALFDQIEALQPRDDTQRTLKSQASGIMLDVGRTRFLMYEQSVTGVSMPLVVMLIVWLTLIFISFGLFAPRNFTVVGSFFVSALSVAGALLLILEMYSPFAGFIQISQAPLLAAIAVLGR
jgi:hypothetical protein